MKRSRATERNIKFKTNTIWWSKPSMITTRDGISVKTSIKFSRWTFNWLCWVSDRSRGIRWVWPEGIVVIQLKQTSEPAAVERACLYLEIDLETGMKVKRWLTICLDCFSIGWSSFEDSKGQLKKKKTKHHVRCSTFLFLIVARPSKPELQQLNQTLIEFGRGKFVCATKGGNPPPTFQWFINQIRVNEYAHRLTRRIQRQRDLFFRLRSFYTVKPNTPQSLSELHLPLEKRLHNGQLICQIDNPALESPLTVTQTLNIQCNERLPCSRFNARSFSSSKTDKPEVALRQGQNIISNLNLLVVENDLVTIDCHIQSNPPLTKSITWLKNNVLLPGEFRQQTKDHSHLIAHFRNDFDIDDVWNSETSWRWTVHVSDFQRHWARAIVSAYSCSM